MESGRAVRGFVAAIAAAAVLSACSEVYVAQDPTESDWVPFNYATTGLPAQPETPRRPVVAVKIDNTAAGQPQQGVAQADLVVQEPVEGGLTRLVAFYESRRPESVGPVRSIRTTDIPLTMPVSATVVTSGGSPEVLQEFETANVPLVVEPNEIFVRNPNRPAPYDLYADLSQEIAGPLPKQEYLDFGDLDLPSGKQVDGMTIVFSDFAQTQWKATGKGQWKQLGTEQPYLADTLLILSVDLIDTGLVDAAGSSVPEAAVVGNGRGFLALDGAVHTIRWEKTGFTEPFEFTTDQGLVIAVPPGNSWINLLPESGGKVSFN
ncbi:MAG: DUF3048 domain-containing protein [Actinomycetia bacterium]|nr:DUF3048 domain-containing protein [Actinomycetes bacterium]MCH9801545.1 DUF3048 domain-containing protein [Actinomycetes bacterium]